MQTSSFPTVRLLGILLQGKEERIAKASFQKHPYVYGLENAFFGRRKCWLQLFLVTVLRCCLAFQSNVLLFTTESRLLTLLPPPPKKKKKKKKKKIENIEGKEENAGTQHFLLFSQCFLSYLG